MKAKWGWIAAGATIFLIFSGVVAKADDGKNILTSRVSVRVFVEALPADLEESGLKEGDFFALVEEQIKKYGIAVVPRQTASTDAVSPILAATIYAKTDTNKEIYAVGCGLSLK